MAAPVVPPLTFFTRCGELDPSDDKPCFSNKGYEIVTKPIGIWLCAHCGQHVGRMDHPWCLMGIGHRWICTPE